MAHGRSTVLLAGLVLASAALPAQLTWRQAGAQVPARAGHFAFFDEARGRTTVFGGEVSGSSYGTDCWQLEANEWMQIPIPALTARGHGPHCEDPTGPGDGLIFSGRLDNSSLIAETLRFHAQALRFEVLAPASSPPPRWISAMAFDSARGRVVLFGGATRGQPVLHNDTWEYHATTGWRLMTPAHRPAARVIPGMAYDEARGRVVLSGGSDGARDLDDTWEWDGTDWTRRVPETAPPPGGRQGMIHDPARGRMVVYRRGVLHELNAPVDVTGAGNTATPQAFRYYSQPILGQVLRLGFDNPQGLALLGFAAGPMQQPIAQVGTPLCETSNLFTLDWLGAITARSEPNVGLPLPNDPSLRGLVLVFQAFAYQAAGCFRATDALNVRFD